jgi:hypothetical protein
MCTSTKSLKDRLRTSLRHGFTAFPEETFPEELRQKFSEIKAALKGVQLGHSLENYPDAIDRMKPSDVRRLFDKIISLRESVAKEYYMRMFQRETSKATKNGVPRQEKTQKAIEVLIRNAEHTFDKR